MRLALHSFSLPRAMVGACFFALAPLASGCSSDNVTNTADAGGGATTADASTTALGFHPSNLGTTLDRLNFAELTDIVVSAPDQDASAACAAAGKGCIAVDSVPQAEAGGLTVYLAKSWKIEKGARLRVKGDNPAVLVAATTIVVAGHVDASSSSKLDGGTKYDTGAGGFVEGGPLPNLNPGAGGASKDSAGAGGAGHCGKGGNGGTVANGGAVYGSLALTPLLGGSAGGSDNGFDGYSGAGGGAVALVAGSSVSILNGGKVTADGGNAIGNFAAGGGSGGAILIEAPSVTILGTLTANGGKGGGGNREASFAAGGSGTTVAGADGVDKAGVGTASTGGGGGAGRIAINTSSGQATTPLGPISPATTTTCTTQGKLQ